MRIGRYPAFLLTLAAFLPSSAAAETWPAWRGVAGTGVSVEKNLPTRWSEQENVLWTAKIPGRSNSSPAVTRDLIFLTTQTEDQTLWVLGIARKAGTIHWKTKVGSGALVAAGPASLYAHRHNPATPSPVADEQYVWAFFGTGLLVCLDHQGTVKWRRDLVRDYGQYEIRFGMASSPRLWNGRLFVTCITKGPSYVVALDAATGRTVWKQDREFQAEDDGPDGYSSPVIHEVDGENAQLLVSGCDHINAYDPDTGEQLWYSSGLKVDSPYGRVIASPAVSEKVIVACSPNPPGTTTDRAIALRPGGKGNVTVSHRLWEFRPYNPDCSTPVIYQGNVYMVRDDGIAACLDAETGRSLWEKRLSAGNYRAALVAGDGKVYISGREGTCTVVQAGDDGRVLAENKLDAIFFATPAISDGVLYLHGYGKLYAIGASAAP